MDWSLSDFHMDRQADVLSLQSNRDVPLLQNIFRRYRQVRKNGPVEKFTSTFQDLFPVCPLKSNTKKSESGDTTTQQEAFCPDDASVFRFLKESHVFLLSFHSFLPPPTNFTL